MIALSLSWLLLLVVTLPIGLGVFLALEAILERLQPHLVDSKLQSLAPTVMNEIPAAGFAAWGDRLILCLWLGTLALMNGLLVASFAVPLSPAVGAAVAAILSLPGLLWRPVQRGLRELLLPHSAQQRRVACAAFLLILLPVALFNSQLVSWFDTGLYHYQSIRWFSESGTVTGLGLLQPRFGFSSTWMALAAPFNAGFLKARMSAVTGGWVMLLVVLHLAIGLGRVARRQDRCQDWLVILAPLVYLPILMLPLVRLINSPSPDVPVIVLTVLVSWSLLNAQGSNRPVERLMPLLLAIGAGSIKLSALPLPLFAGAFYVLGDHSFWQKGGWRSPPRRWWRPASARLAIAVTLVVLGLLPTLYYGFRAIGCPLYPVAFCLDVPWSIGSAEARVVSTIITWFARWSGPIPIDDPYSWRWVLQWPARERQFVWLLVCSAIATFYLLRLPQFFRSGAQLYILVLAWLSNLYVLSAAPMLRLGLGSLCLLPALAIAHCLSSSDLSKRSLPRPAGLIGLTVLLLPLHFFLPPGLVWDVLQGAIFFAVLLCLGLFGWWEHRRLYHQWSGGMVVLFLLLAGLQFQWLPGTGVVFPYLPPQMSNMAGQLIRRHVNDVTYWRPTGRQLCWAAEVPCTNKWLPLLDNIRLKDPGRDNGGYVRSRPLPSSP